MEIVSPRFDVKMQQVLCTLDQNNNGVIKYLMKPQNYVAALDLFFGHNDNF